MKLFQFYPILVLGNEVAKGDTYYQDHSQFDAPKVESDFNDSPFNSKLLNAPSDFHSEFPNLFLLTTGNAEWTPVYDLNKRGKHLKSLTLENFQGVGFGDNIEQRIGNIEKRAEKIYKKQSCSPPHVKQQFEFKNTEDVCGDLVRILDSIKLWIDEYLPKCEYQTDKRPSLKKVIKKHSDFIKDTCPLKLNKSRLLYSFPFRRT